MDLDTLTQTRDKLLEKYKDDEQLIGLVNKTYDYFNEILLKQFLIEELEKNEKKHFSFDDEDSTLKGKQNIEMFEEENNQEEMIKEEAEVPFLDEKKDLFQEQSVLKNTTSIDPKRINELMDIINGNAEAEENVETEEKVEEVKEKDKSKMDTFMDEVYNLLISIILVFAFLIFRIILQEFIISIPSLNSMAITLEKGYLKILEVLFGFVFNSLHMLFKIVPTYKVFVYQNSLLSPMAVLCLFSIILIFIIISMIKGMINLIKNKD